MQKQSRLAVLGVKKTEQDMMLHILCNLPSEYDNTVEMCNKELKDGTLTMNELCGRLNTKFK